MTQFLTELNTNFDGKKGTSKVISVNLETEVYMFFQTELTAILDFENITASVLIPKIQIQCLHIRTTKRKELVLSIPREWNGEFNQQTVTPCKYSKDILNL